MAKALAIALMMGPIFGSPAAHAAGRTPAPTRFAVAFTDLASKNGRIVPRSQNVIAAPVSRSFLQCVPYAREVSGIQLYGDAHTWWEQAAGRYQRGFPPRWRGDGVQTLWRDGVGPCRHGQPDHRSRQILVRHANWSPLGGERGQIEDNVLATDVSPRNDWSEVRVWYQPLGGLGTTHWPVAGFIYNNGAAKAVSGRGWSTVNHGAGHGYLGDPIGAIIAAYSRR
jgi:surface antigen